MSQRRNKPLEILERRKKVAARYLRGQTQGEIARAFEVTQQTISNDLKAIQAEWEQAAQSERRKWRIHQLAVIDEVEGEDGGVAELIIQVREAVERCRARAGAESPVGPARADAALGSAANGRSGDPSQGGDDAEPLAGDVAPFFD